MAISSDSPAPREAPLAATSNGHAKVIETETKNTTPEPQQPLSDAAMQSEPEHAKGVDSTAEFVGEVNTNDDIPSQATLRKVENLSVLDENGRAILFKDLYSGTNVARRVLIIFIRHFFCGVSVDSSPSPKLCEANSDLAALSRIHPHHCFLYHSRRIASPPDADLHRNRGPWLSLPNLHVQEGDILPVPSVR